jgi:hypothetical protein
MLTLEDGSQVNTIPAKYTGSFTNSYGSKIWYLYGNLHRVDGPAWEEPDGSKWWYRNGKYHRLENPACELADGSKYWYQHGKLHRLDGPACESTSGSKEWWVNGKKITKQTKIVCLR